jgi:DNA-binding MarR family transcriptional regulator
MSPATAHKYLKSAVRRKLVLQKRNKEDARGVEFTVATKGNEFLEEIKHAHVRK